MLTRLARTSFSPFEHSNCICEITAGMGIVSVICQRKGVPFDNLIATLENTVLSVIKFESLPVTTEQPRPRLPNTILFASDRHSIVTKDVILPIWSPDARQCWMESLSLRSLKVDALNEVVTGTVVIPSSQNAGEVERNLRRQEEVHFLRFGSMWHSVGF